MIKVSSFLSNENCFAGHGLSTTGLQYGPLEGIVTQLDRYILVHFLGRILFAAIWPNYVHLLPKECNHKLFLYVSTTCICKHNV